MTWFRCLNCARSLRKPPVCQPCLDTLLLAPPLCAGCGDPHAPESTDAADGACPRPWRETPAIQSYGAGYLLVEPGYTLLRRWKKTPSPLLDRQLLEPLRARVRAELGDAGIAAVVPVPQRFARSWALGRSPARTFAEHVARWLDVPVRAALEPPFRTRRDRRQAELSARERAERRFRFGVRAAELPPVGSAVALVDDFRTSGTTLHRAAQALSEAGAHPVSVLCLGIRPRLH
jgi:predicted amidophosphoribosyltransferase